MICVVQHNTKPLMICTGAIWLALPAAIELNYRLSLIANLHAQNYMDYIYMHEQGHGHQTLSCQVEIISQASTYNDFQIIVIVVHNMHRI